MTQAGGSSMPAGYLAVPAGPPPLARLVRLDYKPEAAEDSWRRILAFFGEHLPSIPGQPGSTGAGEFPGGRA
jgi:hypothetical protein